MAFQYMQVMLLNPILFTVKHDELTHIIYVVVCYHANKTHIKLVLCAGVYESIL